jgi:hypothetical protein
MANSMELHFKKSEIYLCLEHYVAIWLWIFMYALFTSADKKLKQIVATHGHSTRIAVTSALMPLVTLLVSKRSAQISPNSIFFLMYPSNQKQKQRNFNASN